VVEGESRVVPIKAELDNPDGSLKPGLFVELEVLTDRTPAAVLVIPKSALVETNENKTIVFVQNGSALQPSEVTLGRESGELVEVKDGLFEGDRIVTQRAPQLYAQSLRSGAKTEAPEATPQPVPTQQNGPLPWWVLIPVGGAIAAGTFGAGMSWANYRHRQALSLLRDGHWNDLANHSNGSSSKLTVPQGVTESVSKSAQPEAGSKSSQQPH
jgi:membrane fusion protein, heavy metal efflux system